jgi:uncharacterized protein (DUF2062 family)
MSLIKKAGLGLKHIYYKTLSKLDSLKGKPKEIAKGFATGVAVSFTPFVGFHLLLSLFITKITKQNATASALGTLVGNPWTFPFIWYVTLHTGRFILYKNEISYDVDFKSLFKELFHAVLTLDFDAFISDIWPEFYPMLIGCIPFCIVVWAIVYHSIYHVLKGKNKKEKE